MKKIFFYLAALLFAGASLNSNAQALKVPQLSSTQTIIQDLGLGKVTVTYSRPNVKGRKMLGGLEPYGNIWRTGANAATIISFTDDVTLNGNKVVAGEYGLFTIPGPDQWTIILNKTAHQWGAYSYKQADDYLRFTVKPGVLPAKMETFTIAFINVTETTAEMHLMWENVDVTMMLVTDVDTKVMANIDQVMNKDTKPYFEAAVYYYENNKDLATALGWIRTAEKVEANSPFYKVWEARILLKMGNKAEALSTAQDGVKFAKAQNDKEYERLNQAVVDQAKM